jgi:hypothetical protein
MGIDDFLGLRRGIVALLAAAKVEVVQDKEG